MRTTTVRLARAITSIGLQGGWDLEEAGHFCHLGNQGTKLSEKLLPPVLEAISGVPKKGGTERLLSLYNYHRAATDLLITIILLFSVYERQHSDDTDLFSTHVHCITDDYSKESFCWKYKRDPTE